MKTKAVSFDKDYNDDDDKTDFEYNFLPLLVIVFNAIFIVLGIGVVAIGAWAHINIDGVSDVTVFISDHAFIGAIILMAAGGLMTLVAVLGCFGAYKKSRLLLLIFVFLTFAAICLEIMAAALAYEKKWDVEVQSTLDKAVANYDPNRDDSNKKAVDALQEKLDCCGSNGYADYRENYKLQRHEAVPDSCCVKTKRAKDCGWRKIDFPGSDINVWGCKTKIVDKLTDKIVVVGAFALTMLGLQFLAMVFAIVLMCWYGDSHAKTLQVKG